MSSSQQAPDTAEQRARRKARAAQAAQAQQAPSSAAATGVQTVTDGARQVTQAAKQAGDVLSPVFDGLIEGLGGWNHIDNTIKDRNRLFYDFAQGEFLNRLAVEHKAAKLLLAMIPLAFLQSVLPILSLPIGVAANLLGFLFLYKAGIKELRAGLRSGHAEIIKSLLTAFMIISSSQLVPGFLFDTAYHFGSMWTFFFPVLLFTRWSSEDKEATIASSICDTFFAQTSSVISSLLPQAWKGDQGQSMGLLVGMVVGLLFWVGYLGSSGSFLTIWIFLAISTINTIGQVVPDSKTALEAYRAQQTIWHNLLAIWLFRYFFSAIESVSIPGIISLQGLILYHLPSYYLWVTAFLFAMLLTKKTVDSTTKVANTWYARWLLGAQTNFSYGHLMRAQPRVSLRARATEA